MKKIKHLFFRFVRLFKGGSLADLKGFDYQFLYPFLFTLLFVFILMQYSFFALEATIFDLWSKLDISKRSTQSYSLVTLDESTDQFLGEIYPYSYATHLKTLRRLVSDRPRAIIYFIDFSSPTLAQDIAHYAEFTALLRQWLDQGQILRFGTNMDLLGEVLPADELRPLGHSLALVNEDSEEFARDGVSRKIILSASGEDSLHLWLSEQLKQTQQSKAKASSDLTNLTKSAQLTFGSYYDYQADAFFTQYRMAFNPLNPPEQVVTIPIHRLVQGQVQPGYFKDKVVFIGHSYGSRPDDFVYTSFSRDQKAAKLVVHAAMIESLLQQKTLYQLPKWVSNTLAILLVLILSVVISRLNPSKGLLFIVGSMFGVMVLSYAMFLLFGWWPSMAHILLSVFLVYYIWVPFRAIAEYQTRFAIQEESKIMKKVDGLKQNFISLMSHDLKTPVAKISGLAEMMVPLVGVGQQELRRHVERLQESIKELNSFITSILDLTKIESQNLKLNLQSKDLNSILELVLDRLTPLADTKQVSLVRDLGPLYPISLDVLLMQRVISNLVENAIKYGPFGQQITLRTWDDTDWVYLTVSDEGQGIDPQELEHIFDKFYRVKNDQSHQIKGTGLGLYLVKYFVELHQGKISVTSEVGRGSTFMLQLKNA